MKPRFLLAMLLTATALALIPFAIIARGRAVTSERPRVHLIGDMDHQPTYRAQEASSFFGDGRAMRPPVPGTVARGRLAPGEHFSAGKADGQWAATFPMSVTEPFLKRGRDQYDVFCSPCHGLAGYGDGMVGKRAARLQEGTWVPPTSSHVDTIRVKPVGEIFGTISSGLRTMPAYGPQIPEADRWAIVAYVRALQRSQDARVADLPPGTQERLP